MAVAFCYRSGEIDFAGRAALRPDGAIPIATTRKSIDSLRAIVEVRARRAYDGVTLLVPGVPEAETDDAALDAMIRWRDWAFPGGRA